MRLAVYLAADGEVETQSIIDFARQRGCQLFAPVMRRYHPQKGPQRDPLPDPQRGRHRDRDPATLWFVRLEPPLRSNRFGIVEPQLRPRHRIDPRWLDRVLVPLVAFGPRGERLGTGAGFYDRAFSFLLRRECWKKPKLIGLAYHWQALAALTLEPWDVPLSAVVTDRGVQCFENF
jgi:5-formyltetrahydrofolate cyclo-ligase